MSKKNWIVIGLTIITVTMEALYYFGIGVPFYSTLLGVLPIIFIAASFISREQKLKKISIALFSVVSLFSLYSSVNYIVSVFSLDVSNLIQTVSLSVLHLILVIIVLLNFILEKKWLYYTALAIVGIQLVWNAIGVLTHINGIFSLKPYYWTDITYSVVASFLRYAVWFVGLIDTHSMVKLVGENDSSSSFSYLDEYKKNHK